MPQAVCSMSSLLSSLDFLSDYRDNTLPFKCVCFHSIHSVVGNVQVHFHVVSLCDSTNVCSNSFSDLLCGGRT